MDSTSKKSIERNEMKRIVAEHGNSISLHDKHGNILLNFQGVKVGNLVGMNVAELGEEYDWSPSLKAIETKSVVTGLVETKYGGTQFVSCCPILDENGQVNLVLVTAIDNALVKSFKQAQKSSSPEGDSYKLTVDYLSEPDYIDGAIVAESPQMREILSTSRIVAKTDISVMLQGESGTGKEVVARFIHRHSHRSSCSFIPVNCAAIPGELMESEFFGYVRGAFTGANPQGKAGLFELADRGTLFLDEIGELPLQMQSKLLRVLETREVYRLGDTAARKVDVRLIAATNRDLNDMMSRNQFRSDLYFRLNVMPIVLPSLRSRIDDILPLANGILSELNGKYGTSKRFSRQAARELVRYDWPGNVRELRNIVERLVVTSAGDELYLEKGFAAAGGEPPMKPVIKPLEGYTGTLKSVLAEVEREYISRVLASCGGRVAQAAEILGVHRSVLYRKMKEF